MHRRTVHCIALNVVTLIVSAFYVLSPAIFAYVSEISMTYARVPTWFARTAPAKMTARIFDRYNEKAPRAARFNQRLACVLTDDGAKRVPGCAHEIRRGQVAYGPPDLKIASGVYATEFTFLESDGCSSGTARLQVVTTGRFGEILADHSGPIQPGQAVELPFRLTLMDAALAAVEFRVSGISGCVLLTGVRWTRMHAGQR